jgi:hypothetical protein
MDVLKKFFPISFGARDVAGLVLRIIIYVLANAAMAFLIGLLRHVWLLGPLTFAMGGLTELYLVGGVVLAVLDYVHHKN